MIRQLLLIILLLTATQALFAQTAGYWVNKAVEKTNNGDYAGAIADCDKALAINPRYLEAFNNRGVAKHKLGQNESAIIDFDQATAINPRSAVVFKNRGGAKTDLKLYSEAIADYNVAIAITPNDAEAYYSRGVVETYSGQYDDAIADYIRCINLDGQFLKAYYNRGFVYYKIGRTRENYRKAMADYEMYIKLGGERTEINYRGKADAAIFNLGDKTYMDEPTWRDFGFLDELFEWKRLKTKHRILTRRDSLDVYTENLQRYHHVLMAANTSDDHQDLTYYNVRTRGPMFNYLCKKAILISKKINPKPAIPEEARKNYVIGISIVNDPSNYKKEDYYPSLEKLLYASIDAPWWYDVYKQLGRANELAENYEEAIRNFQLYLLTKPPVNEARKIQDEIYVIEGKQMR